MNGLRILQVGSSFDIGATTVEQLEQRGHDVAIETVTDGREGLDILQHDRFDCVVFGAELPDMDGLEFLEAVRDGHPNLPTILLAAETDEQRLTEALDIGVTECVRETGEPAQHALLAKRIHDGVEHVEVRRERDEERRFLDQLFEDVPVSLYVKDRQGRHVRLSGFYGADPGTVRGKTDRELYPYVGDQSYRDDMQVIQTGEPILNKVEHLPKSEEWNLTSKAPWYGEDGDIKGLIGVTRRITEQKEYERELQRQNRRLDEFARIVSHELRNPLQIARGRAEILRDRVESNHPQEVIDALDRMSELITSLLALARGKQQVDGQSQFSLADAVEKCWNDIATEDATLVLEGGTTIRADRSQFEHLLENLFENAIEHIDGPVTVRVGPGKDDDGFYVADDGPGIPEQDREDIFEIGYSAGGKQIGYGLRIVAEVAAAHGWDIGIRSSETGGTRFDITGLGLEE